MRASQAMRAVVSDWLTGDERGNNSAQVPPASCTALLLGSISRPNGALRAWNGICFNVRVRSYLVRIRAAFSLVYLGVFFQIKTRGWSYTEKVSSAFG